MTDPFIAKQIVSLDPSLAIGPPLSGTNSCVNRLRLSPFKIKTINCVLLPFEISLLHPPVCDSSSEGARQERRSSNHPLPMLFSTNSILNGLAY